MKLLIFLVASICLFGTAQATSSPGLNYTYYEGTWNTLPDFNSLTPVKKGTTLNFDLGVRNRDLSYGIVWEGNITIPTSGDYTFETSSDDGSHFYINNSSTPLVNNDGEHAAWPVAGTIHLNAGIYPIKVTFFQSGGGQTMEVYWSSNTGITRQRIPDNALTVNTVDSPTGAFVGINNYYFSTTDGDDSRTSTQAKNPATPWKTLDKLNSFFSGLKVGDAVFFKSGNTFYGFVNPASGVYYGAYGTGAKPLISGFTTLSGWTSVGTNLWEASLNTGLRLNMLTVDGVIKAPGRYPNYNTTNGGYLTVTSHTPAGLSSNVDYWNAASTITSSAFPGSWVGAELVLRKNSYTFDRTQITGQSGSTLSYESPSANEQVNNFGFFFQNSVATLDLEGEWFYNSSAHTLRLYSTTNPSTKVVKAATVETLVTVAGKNNIVFKDLAFQGSDTATFLFSDGSNHINIKACDINYSGIEAMVVDVYQTASYITVDSCTINNTNSSAILLYGTSNSTISHTTVKNSNLLPGIPRASQHGYNGIYMKGSNNLIEYNTIDSCGGAALAFNGGSNIIARYNYINYFCTIVCDYGGIYTNGNDGFTGRKIIGNVITNGVGAFLGTDIPRYHAANGIYLDESANDVEVRGNSIYKMSSNGIYIHQSTNNYIVGNTIYDNSENQISMTDDQWYSPRIAGNRVTSNIFFAKTGNQGVLRHGSTTNDLNLFGSYDSNYFARPLEPSGIMNTNYTNGTNGSIYASYDLEGWKNIYGWDKISQTSSISIVPYKIISTNGTNKFSNGTFTSNASGVESGNIITWQNKIDGGSVQVNSVSKTSVMTGGNMSLGSTVAGTTYLIKFSVQGSTNTENVGAYIRRWGGDYAIVSEIKSYKLSTNRTECEFIFTAVTSDQEVKLTILAPESVTPYWFDNISAMPVTHTATIPEDSIRFEYNPFNTVKNVSLNGTYADVKNNKYTNLVSIAPYSSIILIKSTNQQANQAPTARAGNDLTILLPTNTVTVNGSASTDTDGTIQNYTWKKIAGPTQFSIANPSSMNTLLSNLVQGTYSFQLSIVDNEGLGASDTVVVSVMPKPNQAPVARAGSDITILLPTNSVALKGNTSTDADGTIKSYTWTKLTGPSQYSIVFPSSTNTTVRNLVAGTYSFKLSITDNSGAAGYDTVLVNVKPKTSTALINDYSTTTTSVNTESIKTATAEQLSVYPNPVANMLNTRLSHASIGKVTLTIYNLNGATIQSAAYQKTEVLFEKSVNVSTLHPGVYYIEYKLNDGTSILKPFVKH